LQKQLATVGEKLMAFLPPPNPEELQAKARKRHVESLMVIAGYDIEDIVDEAAAGKYWLMVSKQSQVQKGRTAIDWCVVDPSV
jgi:hypothetical protein